jgi:hypothetical protein
MALYYVGDNPRNKVALDKFALSVAGKGLVGSDQPVILTHVVGFAACPIDGLVSSVEWSQVPPMTAVEQNTWYRPLGAVPRGHGARMDDGGHAGGAGGGGGRGGIAGQIAQGRVARGSEGARPFMMPLNPAPPREIPPGALLCKVLNPLATLGGYYDGSLYAGILGGDGSSGSLILPGGLQIGDRVLLSNVDEASLPTARIAAGSYVIGMYVGPSDEAQPRPQIAIHGGVGDTGTITNLGGNRSNADAVDGHTWRRDIDGTGVSFAVQTREYWNPTGGSGNGTLADFSRTLTFDARGMLVFVGAEERVQVLAGVPGCI